MAVSMTKLFATSPSIAAFPSHPPAQARAIGSPLFKRVVAVSAVGDVSSDSTTYLIAGAAAVALIGTAFPILFSRKDMYVYVMLFHALQFGLQNCWDIMKYGFVFAVVLNVMVLGSSGRQGPLWEPMLQGRINLRLFVPTVMVWESLDRLINETGLLLEWDISLLWWCYMLCFKDWFHVF